MPGRLHLATSPTQLGDLFGVITMDPSLRFWTPRYNIAPGQETLIIRALAGITTRAPVPRSQVGRPLAGMPCELTTARWGLAKAWAVSPDLGVPITDAALEHVHTLPRVWDLLVSRRCLVPVDGFYEWKTRTRQPTWVGVQDPARRGTAPFAMAAVWDRWELASADREFEAEEGAAPPAVVDTFAILTTASNAFMAGLHERMPVILTGERAAAWLDPECNDAERARSACVGKDGLLMTAYEVSPLVNSPRHDDPRCLEPAARLALPGFDG